MLVLASCGFAGCTTVPQAERSESKTLFAWNAPDGPGPDEKVTESPGVDPIVTDRPDFTEASSTVGKGRVQLEAGYTYVRDRSDGTTSTLHSYPEALLRIGLFADWFELRIGQNLSSSLTRSTDESASSFGVNDLYLGTKLGLTEQRGLFPEAALVLQALIPTGSRSTTSGEVLPGANLLYGWTVIEDRLSVAGSTQVNRTLDEAGRGRALFAQSVTVGYTLTEKLGAYTEWFAFLPTRAPESGSEHYFNGGFTYKVTPTFQLDIRAGLGLNERADDFFAGTGFAIRY